MIDHNNLNDNVYHCKPRVKMYNAKNKGRKINCSISNAYSQSKIHRNTYDYARVLYFKAICIL